LLGLHDLGEFGQRWILLDVVWATLTGIAIGVVAGWGLAHVGVRLRAHWPDPELLNDFLGLGLIGVVYGISLWLSAWGFLAVFFAAVTLRHTELKLAGVSQEIPPPPRLEGRSAVDKDALDQNVSAASLIFKEHLERLSELVLILLIGGMLFVDSWSWRAVGLALFIFSIARPLSVMIGLIGTRTTWRMRGLVGWFGVRGIGSLYYLMYAIQHGLAEDLALELLQLTLVVVTLSILIHGITAKPMMSRFWNQPVDR
jgi:NhaP-type Na+/H+ or K+/H+ antiporter